MNCDCTIVRTELCKKPDDFVIVPMDPLYQNSKAGSIGVLVRYDSRLVCSTMTNGTLSFIRPMSFVVIYRVDCA